LDIGIANAKLRASKRPGANGELIRASSNLWVAAEAKHQVEGLRDLLLKTEPLVLLVAVHQILLWGQLMEIGREAIISGRHLQLHAHQTLELALQMHKNPRQI
jgi:hypothetical protein